MKKLVRQKFRESVFARDKFTCRVCGEKRNADELDAHHIVDRSEMENGGYVASNGISVCKNECHVKVELFHISEGQEWHEGLHPDDLYVLIGSSRAQADIDSALL